MVNSEIVRIPIRKYKKTISERVSPLGTVANAMMASQLSKAIIAMDIMIIL